MAKRSCLEFTLPLLTEAAPLCGDSRIDGQSSNDGGRREPRGRRAHALMEQDHPGVRPGDGSLDCS